MPNPSPRLALRLGMLGLLIAGGAVGAYIALRPAPQPPAPALVAKLPLNYRVRQSIDTGGILAISAAMGRWPASASLEDVARAWTSGPKRFNDALDAHLANPVLPTGDRIQGLIHRAAGLHYVGQPERAAAALDEARTLAGANDDDAEAWLYSVVYFQGVTALRRGETDNCIMCRGESSCILPLAPAALHTNPGGSRLAIKYLTEYLNQFPDDYEVRWLLNVAHITLGEHPDKVDPRFVIRLDSWAKSEFDLGRFRNVGDRVGIARLSEAGATVLDDFDGDGYLDLFFTSWNANVPVVLYKNLGNGKFEDVTDKAGLKGQLGGLGAAQVDFDNDGHLDLYLPRGAWLHHAIRPSLMRNKGNGTFEDVTDKAGLLDPVNSDTVAWADFDNDGNVDLFVACEQQRCRLYRNKGNGTFEDVTEKAGLAPHPGMWKGVNWLDYDNDGFPELFLNNIEGTSKLFHNNRSGTFTEVTFEMGITGPPSALACWAWDYNNDGFLDIFAPCYDRSVEAVVKGMAGVQFTYGKNRVYRNMGGKGFKDVTKEVGLDMGFLPMGCNFGDFDNDGFLDFYLGTGDHGVEAIVPNRMLKNVGGKRFADVTASSGTGHLQKGHAVGCGDWDRNGTVDIAGQIGGAFPGDSFHNVLFQNPGQGNNWLSVKLVGKKTNRSAMGVRIKAVTPGAEPLTVHRHVSSGSSFGGNPLEQHIGVGKAEKVATLEIHWPTSGTTQVFRDVPVSRAIEITEFATEYKTLDRKPITLPK